MIIGDACSIILLAKSSILEEFAKRRKIIIPSEVYNEIMAGKEKSSFDALLTEKLINEKKITIKKISNPKITEKLSKDFGLGKGESEAITLALTTPERIILTDNKQGRKTAKFYGLKLIGSVEVVVALYNLKHISKEKALNSLEILKKIGWFEDSLIERAKGDIEDE